MLTKFLKDTTKKVTYSVTYVHPENIQQFNIKMKTKIDFDVLGVFLNSFSTKKVFFPADFSYGNFSGLIQLFLTIAPIFSSSTS